MLRRTSRERSDRAAMYIRLLKETMEQLSVFNVFDTRDPPKLSVIACGSRDVSLNCRDIPSLMCTGLGLLIDWGGTLLQDKWLIKIHIQVFAVGFDIAFPGFYQPIHAEVILLCIDAF